MWLPLIFLCVLFFVLHLMCKLSTLFTTHQIYASYTNRVHQVIIINAELLYVSHLVEGHRIWHLEGDDNT